MARDTLQAVIEDAIDSLRTDWKHGNVDLDNPHDYIHETADGAVPVYHSTLLNIAANDNEVATRVPEIGPAFDGSHTPVNIIAANIFELVCEALWEEVRRMEDEEQERIDSVSDMDAEEVGAELARIAKESNPCDDNYKSALEERKADLDAEKEAEGE